MVVCLFELIQPLSLADSYLLRFRVISAPCDPRIREAFVCRDESATATIAFATDARGSDARLRDRNLKEALDHGRHLLRRLELMKVACTDGHANVEVGLERKQPLGGVCFLLLLNATPAGAPCTSPTRPFRSNR
jgi:hypothetical protein